MDRNRDKRGVSTDFKDNLCESRPLPRDTGLQFWQYIRNLPGENPSSKFVRYVDEVEQKEQDWDISRIIHLFHERGTTPNAPEEIGYKVLRELTKLYRECGAAGLENTRTRLARSKSWPRRTSLWTRSGVLLMGCMGRGSECSYAPVAKRLGFQKLRRSSILRRMLVTLCHRGLCNAE